MQRVSGPRMRIDTVLDYAGYDRTYGILGQSFDRNFRCAAQERDIYEREKDFGSVYTTRAQARGCIRGSVDDYKQAWNRAPSFP